MQSRLTKFHHAHKSYWDKVGRALVEQYHRNAETAQEWAMDKSQALEDEHGRDTIPPTPPERMAQEIFMERCDADTDL